MKNDICVVVEHLRGQVFDITYTLLAAARHMAKATGGKVIAILLGNNASHLSSSLAADQVLYAEHPALEHFTPDGYLNALAELIPPLQPRLVLLGNTAIGADVAGGLSIKLRLPLVSSVLRFREDCRFTSQICGGKILAEGELPAPTALVTLVPGGYLPQTGHADAPPPLSTHTFSSLGDLRIKVTNFIEPASGSVDISKEPFIIGVGRGIQIQENLALVDELAADLGGVICSSRPLIDQGWMPFNRLVGKSGKPINPRVYLAIGISGAPEHTESILGSGTIIAINSDPDAPIFNLAQYGTTADLFELLPILTELVRQAKNQQVQLSD